MKALFSEEKLWELRNQIRLNSLFTSDYENTFGLNPRAVQDFFDGYLDELEYMAEMDGGPTDITDILAKYDTPENLKNWYDSYEVDPFGLDEPSEEELMTAFPESMDKTDLEDRALELEVEPAAEVVPEELKGAFKTMTEKQLTPEAALAEVKKTIDDYQKMLDEDTEKGDDLYAAGMQAMIDALRDSVSGISNFYKEAREILSGRLTEAVDGDGVDRVYEICDILGTQEVFDNLIKWLPYDTVAEFAEDIARDYDLDYEEEDEEDWEDEEDPDEELL